MTPDRPLAETLTDRGMVPAQTVIEEPANLRPKNQVTIPKAAVEALGLELGERLMFVVRTDQPDRLQLFRLPNSFAGIAPHAYGDATSSADYVRGEREAWEE